MDSVKNNTYFWYSISVEFDVFVGSMRNKYWDDGSESQTFLNSSVTIRQLFSLCEKCLAVWSQYCIDFIMNLGEDVGLGNLSGYSRTLNWKICGGLLM